VPASAGSSAVELVGCADISVAREKLDYLEDDPDRRNCEGLRMTAHCDDAAGTGAVIRMPPGKERAGREVRTLPRGYGDLIAAMRLSARSGGVRLG
jgi:hypothetical protein